MVKRTSATVFSIRIDDELLRLADLVARSGDETAELNRSRFFVELARAEVERIIELGKIQVLTDEIASRGLDKKDFDKAAYNEIAALARNIPKSDFIKLIFRRQE